MSQALLVVDVQNDFLPGGSLGVNQGDAVVPVANALIQHFDYVVATQDWHPAQHQSFASQHDGAVFDIIDLDGLEQILWPDHCVQNTAGASFASNLDVAGIDYVVQKGTDERIDSYSAFFDNGHRKSTGLAEHFKQHGIDEIAVVGIAADVCVLYSVLDALKAGFKVTVVRDGIRGVDMNGDDTQRALEQMQKAGATITDSQTLLA